MKVICPKCQYENQSSSSQVFCARCATMIDVRSQREASPDREYQSGAPLPYSGRPAGSPVPGAVQPGGRLPGGRLPGGSLEDGQFPVGGGYHRPPVSSGRERDAYATRVDGDFNDLLEIETRGEREAGAHWRLGSGWHIDA
ncbi:MAG: hypothetical protein EBZ36_02445 [Acidobacteria bacterium]|nr:hypothetical protein [Acidobacteriota bacterium]